jgi:hypothetical protein
VRTWTFGRKEWACLVNFDVHSTQPYGVRIPDFTIGGGGFRSPPTGASQLGRKRGLSKTPAHNSAPEFRSAAKASSIKARSS